MEGYPAVLAIAPAVLFCCLTAVERGYYEGLCSMTPTALSQTAEALTKLVCGLWLCRIALTCPELPSCLARFGREGAAAAAAVLGVTLSTFVGYLCTLLYGLHREKTVPSAPSCLHSGSILRSLFAIMVPVALGSLVTNLTALIDLTTVMRMFGKMISTDSVAFYRGAMLSESISPEKAAAFAYGSFMGLSVTVFNLVPSVTNMFAKGVLPCTAQAWARGDRREAASLAGQVLVLTAMVAVPAGCGIFALSREVLAFLFAGRETEITVAYSSLKWLMPGLVCLCLTFPVFSLLQAMGRADLPVKLMVPGVVLKLLGNLLLIPVFYTAGAALSTSICYGVILLLSLFGLRRVLGEGLHICKTICCILYAGILCGGAAYLCYGIAIGYFPQRIAFLAAVLTGGAVYVLTLFLLRRTLDIRKIRSCSV
jgi:stage V sporulation protein B